MAICKLCKEDKKLIKAHVIPESFFKTLKGPFEYLSVVPSPKCPTAVGRTYIGEYDKNILCKECDAKLGVWDEYGKEVLIDHETRIKEVKSNNEVIGWELKIDKPLIFYKFVLSLLWRASISTRPYYNLIDLGPHEEQVRLAFERDTFDDTYEVFIAKFDESSVSGAEKSILNPYSARVFDRNFCRVLLNGFLISIKVDKQLLEPRVRQFKLKEEDIKVIRASFDESGHLNIMLSNYPSN